MRTASMTDESRGGSSGSWALVTHHAAALIFVAEHPEARISDIARAVGVTERCTAHLLSDLRSSGYLLAARVGRRNVYRLDLTRPMPRRPEKQVSDLLKDLVVVVEGAIA